MSKHESGIERASEWFDPDVFVATVVSCKPRRVVKATVHPFNLYSEEDAEITASVSWEGLDVVASIVQGNADSQPWFRCMQVVWAVMSPETAPVKDEFSPARWSKATLWLPDVAGDREGKVIVELRREGWKADVDWPSGPRRGTSVPIPVDLRHLDVGSLLVELTSRLVFGKSWL